MKMKAKWKNIVIAESEDTKFFDNNYYFPKDSLRKEFFKDSQDHTTCPWKGIASYFDVVVEGDSNKGSAWYYPNPSQAASEIKDYVAFWKGVKVEKS